MKSETKTASKIKSNDNPKNDKNIETLISKTAIKIRIPLKMSLPTPAFGNCWWECIADQMRINKMRKMSPSMLRKNIIKNIEQCESFDFWKTVSFHDDINEVLAFKQEQLIEGTFTDMDGVAVLATAEYLGVSIKIYTSQSSAKYPYMLLNPGKHITFNIFLDITTEKQEHYQSLKITENINLSSNKNITKNIANTIN